MKDKFELLRGTNLFSTLMDPELDVIAGNSEYYSFKKGDTIFSEGSYSDGLYIIEDGEVIITKHKEGGDEMDIARYIQGESFGELDLLENAPMSATARAESDATLLVFPSKATRFRDVLGEHPKISARILHELLAMIAGRIRNTNRLITESSQWVQDLRNQLHNDKLTGLYNRTFLGEDFASRLPAYGDIISFIMIKPDNFKEINDNYGHAAGDKALRLIADTVKSLLRENDIAVRYRGDEFAAILPNTDTKEALDISEYIRSSISKLDFKHLTEGSSLTVTVSIGIATYPDHAEEANELMGLCFDKMFEARESGGDCILSLENSKRATNGNG